MKRAAVRAAGREDVALLDFEAAFPRLHRFVRERYAPYARIGPVEVLRRRETALSRP